MIALGVEDDDLVRPAVSRLRTADHHHSSVKTTLVDRSDVIDHDVGGEGARSAATWIAVVLADRAEQQPTVQGPRQLGVVDGLSPAVTDDLDEAEDLGQERDHRSGVCGPKDGPDL